MALLGTTSTAQSDRTGAWTPSELRSVVVRTNDGSLLQVGTAPNRESALVLARTVIAEIAEPRGEWPIVGDRVLQPESIVSVDVLTTTG